MRSNQTSESAAHVPPLRKQRSSSPGDVRELKNCMERAFVLGSTRFIEPYDLPEERNEPAKPHAGFSLAMRTAIIEAWAQADSDYKQAAALLGSHPNSLLRMIRRLGLRSQLR